MMKRIALFALCLFVVTGGAFAQKKNVTGAALELNKSNPDIEKTRKYLEEAAANPSTSDYPKTWFLMGKMYMVMLADSSYNAEQPHVKAKDAFFKLVSLDPKYEEQTVNSMLLGVANVYYQKAYTASTTGNYTASYDLAKEVVNIHDLENGTRFKAYPTFDTFAVNAQVIMASSAFNAKDYDKAIPAYEQLVSNPIYSQPNGYSLLAAMYLEKNDNDKALAAINKGRAAFPSNKQLSIDEINYYIRTGQQDVFVKKLEDAVQADPNNPELYSFLAQGYMGLAAPDGGDKAANYDELMGKAEAAYAKAVELDPNNYLYNFNFGAFYFNRASAVFEQMNKLGTSAADDKKYGELDKIVKELFAKALPLLTKTQEILEPKLSTMDANDKSTYISSLSAMREIYARSNEMDKAKEMKTKIDQARAQ